ncbi:MAG TPA: DUF433 domain-containing protein [Planctomycetota bacterium]|nr:DUF433 domain-containing protein [Planctomycetota bacterium]
MRSTLIRGTRVHVRAVVEYWKQGLSIEEILEALPHLRPAQVLDALSYYHDHRAAIEREIREAAIPRVLRRRGLRVTRDGRVGGRRAPR